MKIKFILFWFLITCFGIHEVNGQSNDATIVTKIVADFFRWYATVTNNEQIDEYQSKFVQDKRGMVTLDYAKYVANLRRLHFSNELINKEIESYKECIGNVNKIKFSEMNKKFDDIDDYGNIGCDFFNSYRWTSTMDQYDGAKIVKVIVNGNTCIVNVQLYNYYAKKKEYDYWPEKYTVILKKISNSWKITVVK